MAYKKPYYNENHKLVRYRWYNFIGDAFSFLVRFFSPGNILHAFKTVIRGYREYAAFFLALLLVQSFFWFIWMDDKLYAENSQVIIDNCDCNLIVEGFTDEEWVNLCNNKLTKSEYKEIDERGYVSYTVSRYYGNPGEVLYRVKFILTDNSEETCEKFIEKYPFYGENISISYGEKTRLTSGIKDHTAVAVLDTFLILIPAVFIVLSLFYIRTNHFKFKYGIYMAFGADFEKLVESTAWEMAAAAVLAVIPAALISAFVFFLITKRFLISVLFRMLIPELVWVLALIFLSVIPAVKIISKKTPLEMITGKDNSNYVSSPRRSLRIFGKKFPFDYELFSFLRFRKYYVLLLVFAILFATGYSCGLFVADTSRQDYDNNLPQFILHSTYDYIDEYDLDEISDYEGVTQIYWEREVSATAISAHILLNEENVYNIYSKTVDDGHGKRADNNFRYLALSEWLQNEIIDKNIWTIEGDLSQVNSGENMIAISCSLNNEKLLNFKVGDKVTLAKLNFYDTSVHLEQRDKRLVLSQLLKGGDFNYYEYTICAVVDTGSASDEYSVIVSNDNFELLTKKSPECEDVEIYVDRNIELSALEKLRDKVSGVAAGIGGMTMEDTGFIYERLLEGACKKSSLLHAAAYIILAVSPLVWFYSQMMFVRKRETEIYMLGALGGTDKDLSGLFAFSGGALGIFASVCTGILASLLTYLFYYFKNVFLTSLGFGDGINYSYNFSWPGFAICVLSTCLFALVSTWLPFYILKKEKLKTLALYNGKDNAGAENKGGL